MSLGELVIYIGFIGVSINKDELMKILMSIELVLVAMILEIVCMGQEVDDKMGEVISVIVMSTAGGESAVGLGLVVNVIEVRSEVGVSRGNTLHG